MPADLRPLSANRSGEHRPRFRGHATAVWGLTFAAKQAHAAEGAGFREPGLFFRHEPRRPGPIGPGKFCWRVSAAGQLYCYWTLALTGANASDRRRVGT